MILVIIEFHHDNIWKESSTIIVFFLLTGVKSLQPFMEFFNKEIF